MRRLLGMGSFALFLLTQIGCGGSSPASDPWGGKPGTRVLVSFVPLYSFAANVAGDEAQVKCMLTTTGPHSHGESIREEQVLLARGADAFFINGLGLDEAIATKVKGAAGSKKWNLIEVGEALDQKLLLEGECHHDHGHVHDHEHGIDPHVWLGPTRAKGMVEVIRDHLKKIDPQNASKYESNADAYLKKLDALLSEGQAKLKDKKERSFISFHDSLQYFTQAFDLKVADVIEVDAGVEPNEKKMNEIVQKCEKEKIRVITVEPQFPARNAAKKIMEALKAKGIEAVFVEIDPLETCEPGELTAELYEKKMRANIDNLVKVLK